MKRLISIIMMLCILGSMLGMSAFAEEYLVQNQADFEAVLATAEDGSVIKLDHGEFKMPDAVKATSLTIQGKGENSTKLTLPENFVNSGIVFENMTVENAGSGFKPGEGLKTPKGLNVPYGDEPNPQSEDEPVAMIGDVGYGSIQAAVAAAKDGDVIKVVKDHTMVATETVGCTKDNYAVMVNVEGKSVTIDLNGKTVLLNTGDDTIYGVFATADNGHLKLTDSVGTGSVRVTGEKLYALVFCYGEGSSIIIEGGSYSASHLAEGRGLIYAQYSDSVSVSGGKYSIDNGGKLKNQSPWIFNVPGQNDGFINVSGGTFPVDVLHQFWRFEVKSAPDTMLIKNNDGTWSMVKAVASVGEQVYLVNPPLTYPYGFASLEDAMDAADDDNNPDYPENVTLVSNATLGRDVDADHKIVVADGKNITLDLNNKKIIGNYGDALFQLNPGAKLTVTGNGEVSNAGAIFDAANISTDNLVIAGGTWNEFDPTPYLADGAEVEILVLNHKWKVIPPPTPVGAPASGAVSNPYSVPSTADNSNVTLWSALFILFAAAAIITRKKKA